MTQRRAEPAATTMLGEVATAGAVGTTVELCDFLIFGTACALAPNKLFFPAGNPRSGDRNT
ncbi:MAG TPA: hypothetical protein VHX38_22670 [Pseudonocardiaceae bacterium]|jgi:hypothetical protein|nr:hypothetical protein [Pseudonocardiaceae bacterium]